MQRHHSQAGGFILIYVAVTITAISLILGHVMQLRTGIPQQQERIVSHMLRQAEAVQLLDFMLINSSHTDWPVDARYQRYRDLLAKDPARLSEMEQAIEQLRSALAGYGFNILGKDPGPATEPVEWSEKDLYFNEGGQRHIALGGTQTIKLGGRDYRIAISPGNARPNLNGLEYKPLARYLRYLGIPETEARVLAANIIDWRDPDNFVTEQIGAEREYYMGLPRPYPPRNAPIENWQELAYIRGMTPDWLQLLRDNFTISRVANAPVLATHLRPEALAALVDLKPDAVAPLLASFHALMQGGNTSRIDIPTNLMGEEAKALEKLITWTPDPDSLRIEVSTDAYSLTLDYDVKLKRVLGSW